MYFVYNDRACLNVNKEKEQNKNLYVELVHVYACL